MRNSALCALCVLAILGGQSAFGEWNLIVDLLDGEEPGAPAPSGAAVVDIFADVPNGGLCEQGDPWTVAGLNAHVVGGATLRYARDPVTHEPLLLAPGTSDRFVTFFSRSVQRDADARFGNGPGASVSLLGSWCPSVPEQPIAEPGLLSVSWYFPTPESCSFQVRDWYIGRVAIDLNDATIERVGVFRPVDAPVGWHPVFLTGCATEGVGFAGATYYQSQFVGYEWGIYAPECYGDLNGDREIGLADLSILLAHFGVAGGAADGDLDLSGEVTISDLSLLLSRFGGICS